MKNHTEKVEDKSRYKVEGEAWNNSFPPTKETRMKRESGDVPETIFPIFFFFLSPYPSFIPTRYQIDNFQPQRHPPLRRPSVRLRFSKFSKQIKQTSEQGSSNIPFNECHSVF